MRTWSCAVVVLLSSVFASAQAPGVPIHEVPLPDQDPAEDRVLIAERYLPRSSQTKPVDSSLANASRSFSSAS
jgi:hypothetical protein